VEALVKQRNHGEHGAGLYHHVEEVGLPDVQPTFGNEQVAGGGHRQELGDPFNYPSRITAIQSGIGGLEGKSSRKTSPKCETASQNHFWQSEGAMRHGKRPLFLLLAEHGADAGLGCLAALPDLQLAENGMPAM